MTTLTRLTDRPYASEADLTTLVALQQACEAVDHLDHHETLGGWQHWLTSPTTDPSRDMRLWEDADGALRAAAWLWLPAPGNEAEPGVLDGGLGFCVHPDVRGEGDIETAILAWGEGSIGQLAAERGLRPLIYADSQDTYAYGRQVLESHGYTPARYFFTMRRDLHQPIPAPELPAGYTVRTVQGEAEVPSWIEMFNLSFIDHWNFHPATVERRLHRMADPAYRAEGDLIAIAPDGVFAAFCACAINDEENAASGIKDGWIGVLGTRRGYRKIGLGRAMLRTGMEYIKSQGLDWAVLGVDATNPTGALRLYESEGFVVDKNEIAYSKSL